jgi:hypothetical protein
MLRGATHIWWSLIIASLVLLLGVGCDEWDKYWEEDSQPGFTPPPDTTAPVVRILAPAGGDSLTASPISGSSFSVELEASDDKGISKVELYIDDELTALFVEEPFSYIWDTTPLEEGSIHQLWAEALDTSDNATTTDTVFAVVFNAGPQIRLTAPETGALVAGEITLTAEPVDPRTPLLRIDFLVDGIPLGSASTSPFEVTWDSAIMEPGSHFLSAMAFGENNQIGISPFVQVSINNSPPRVRATFPEDGRRVAERGIVPFSATAVDTVHGSIGDSLVWVSDLDGEFGLGHYLRYDELSIGVHRVTASATNAWGLTGSHEIQVIVDTPTYDFCWDLYFPFLITSCYACHTPTDEEYYPESEYDMSSYNATLAGGKSLRELGLESVVPCKPESSLVWIKVYDETPPVGDPMPPPGDLQPLTPEQLERVRTWIEEGAPPPSTPGAEDGC